MEASSSFPGNLTILSCYATCSANSIFPHVFLSGESELFFHSAKQLHFLKTGTTTKKIVAMSFFSGKCRYHKKIFA